MGSVSDCTSRTPFVCYFAFDFGSIWLPCLISADLQEWVLENVSDDLLAQTAALHSLVHDDATESEAWAKALVEKRANLFKQGMFTTSIVPTLPPLIVPHLLREVTSTCLGLARGGHACDE